MSDRDAVNRAGAFMVDIVDHLKHEDDRGVVLTALGAAVVFELDRFGATIEEFADSLRTLKRCRDAELARQLREK